MLGVEEKLKKTCREVREYLNPATFEMENIKVVIRREAEGQAYGVWLPIVVRVKDKCFIVSGFCNTGFGFPRDETPRIAIPVAILLIENLITEAYFTSRLALKEEIFQIPETKHVHVGLMDDAVEFRWIEAEVHGYLRLPGRVLINIPLMLQLGVSYDPQEWRKRVWYPIDNPSVRRPSVASIIYDWELLA